MLDYTRYPNLNELFSNTISTWPAHQKFLEKSIQSHSIQDMEKIEKLAGQIKGIIGRDLKSFINGYRWMCEAFIEEEIHFRRTGEYRCEDFSTAHKNIYDHPHNMRHYMRGLLLSQVLWSAHTQSYLFFVDRFLPNLPDQYSILEVGFGHGLLLANAAKDPRCSTAEGWDLSLESLDHCKKTIRYFSVCHKVQLKLCDLFEPETDIKFDSIVLSELLEHLEDPARAVEKLKRVMHSKSMCYINIPVNSPAPDHITLWRSMEEVVTFIQQCGYEVLDKKEVPASGYTIEKAQALSASINCLLTVRLKT